jgi:gliding motility-associated-like protein
VNKAGCIASDTVYVEPRSDSLVIAPGDTVICMGDKISLTAHTGFPVTYRWSNGSDSRAIEVSQAGSYTLTVNNECGPMTDSVRIDLQNCSCVPFLPTAFSPNRDGLNDLFEIKINCLYRSYQLALFNRYGQKIFTSNDPDQGWDGTFENRDADAGVYFYTLKYVSLDGKAYSRKGDVTLIR